VRLAEFAVAALIATALTLCGCDKDEHDPEVLGAHETFIAAIKARDAGRVLELSQPELAEHMDKLYAEMAEVAARITKEYPAHDRDAALANIGAELLKGVSSGRELFIALVDFTAVRWGADVDRGLAVKRIDRDGAEAVVETAGGETFRYIQAKDGWHCTTALAQFESYPSLKTLRHNIGIAKRNLGTWSKATAESLDPTKPEGAFNIVALTVKRGARVMLYGLLDKPSHERLKAGAAAATKYQAAVEKRFPKKADRHAYLQKRGISWVERVSDEKTLFAALWDAKVITGELDFPDPVKIDGVRGEGDVQSVVIKKGDADVPVAFRRALGGRWMLSHLEPALEREVVRKLEAELGAIPVAGAPAAP